jgi:Protein of unknown function (DUF1524)
MVLAILVVVAAVVFLSWRNGEEQAGTTTTAPPTTAPATTAAPTTAPPASEPPATTTTTAGEPTPVTEALARLRVADETGAEGYEREAFGDGWAATGDGCDTRDQVLADESTVPVTRGGDSGCQVVAGNWVSLYDNYSTPDPGELEVDHMVPLAEAWASGAAAWPADRREAYANDVRRPDALVAVTAATNQSKSDQDPAEWMPSHRDSWCRYVTAWVTQKAAWRLTVDRAEHEALTNVLATCPA